jgi:type II secretion system protein G
MRRARPGFTLIEMLIVTAIISLLLAITIPNLLVMMQRARQKRTMGDMHAIALAIENYHVDVREYPPSAASTSVILGGLDYPTVSIGAHLEGYIHPTYLKVLPLTDGWSSWFLYTSSPTDYAVVSCGKDGLCSEPSSGGPTTNFNSDIVISDGAFTVYPLGAPQ